MIMKTQTFVPIVCASISLSIALPSMVKANPNSPVFLCETQNTSQTGGSPYTYIKFNGKISSPMLVYKTKDFGPPFTPNKRCGIISERFTNMAANGNMNAQNITHGWVNQYPVICLTQGQGNCNEKNMLFTLKKGRAKEAAGIVVQLQEFASNTGNVIPPVETSRQYHANLGAIVNKLIPSVNSGNVNTPSQPTGGSQGGSWF